MKKILLHFLKHRAAALLFSLTFLFAFTEISYGHAFPDHSDPKVGATVLVAPTMVRIWFDAALEPAFSTISVQDSNAKKVDKGDGHVANADPTLLEVNLLSLSSGTYKVIWNVVARDGHRTTGNYTFVIK